MRAVGDDYMSLVMISLVVFAITLTITKSNLFACKREFVTKRYEASFVNGTPLFVHKAWWKFWTCPMCSGMWVAAFVCLFCSSYGYIPSVLSSFAINWLWHCVENILFNLGKLLSDDSEDSVDSSGR